MKKLLIIFCLYSAHVFSHGTFEKTYSLFSNSQMYFVQELHNGGYMARDSVDHPLINQNISLRLSIFDSSSTGQAVYVETQNATTNGSGLFNMSIGMGSAVKFTSKFKGGFICAKAVTSCGLMANTCLNVVLITTKPVTPGIITGPSSLCPNETATYFIASVSKASSYLWAYSGNIQILSGQVTTSIVVKALSNCNGGSVKVRASNCSGISESKTLNVAKSAGCRITSQTVIAPSKINTEAFSAYPIQLQENSLFLNYSETKSKLVLKVIDLLGKNILINVIEANEVENLKVIDLGNLAKGMYFLKIE